MRMRKLKLAALASWPLHQCLAQSSEPTTVTLHLLNYQTQTIYASVITANPTATAFLLTCPENNLEAEDPQGYCHSRLYDGITVTEGPSTLEIHITDTGSPNTNELWCTLLGGDNARCSSSVHGYWGTTTGTDDWSSMSQWAIPVTVTAGLEKLAAATGTPATAGSTTTESSGSAPTPAPTPAPTGSGTAGAASASKASTAGIAAVTGNAVVAGVAAVLGGVLVV